MNRAGDRQVPEDVVGVGRLLDEPGVKLGKLPDPLNRLRHIPDLIGVDHHPGFRPHLVAEDAAAAQIVLEIAADLDLEVRPAAAFEIAALLPQRLVAVAEPAGGGRVAGVARVDQVRDPLRLARLPSAEQLKGRSWSQRVGEVAEVDRGDKLLRRHLTHQPPQRLAVNAGPQIPDGVHDRGSGEMDHPLLRADPAEL